MLWSFHHILLDGWSAVPIASEVVLIIMKAGSRWLVEEQPVDRYEDYIRFYRKG